MARNRWNVDHDYIVNLRHELHMYPEINYDNPLTLDILRRELKAIGLPYTEKFGRSSIVATLNEGVGNITIGIRADMDALYMQEVNDIPFRSTIDGQMHACGHDIHTAVLMGTAKALTEMKDKITCCVKFIFQAAEEGPDTGARYMVADGVMDDIDVVMALHVENKYKSGTIGLCVGPSMALCHPFKIILDGASGHITTPHQAIDAVAMAVRVYNGIQMMRATEIDPLEQYICGIGAVDAGQSFGSVGGHAEMEGVITAYNADLDNYLIRRIETIVHHAAEDVGGVGRLEHDITCLVTNNDSKISELLKTAATKVIGADNCVTVGPSLGCEDFSFFQSKKPGVHFWLGTGNEDKKCTQGLHSNDFMVDEDHLDIGSSIFVQFVLDNMCGIR